MAVLGSTVDPRLGAVNPAAIQALSQAGAASGQMYSNLGGSIAGVIQDFKSKRDDSALQEALAAHGSFDEKTGKLTVDRKAFLQAAKDNKVSSRLANAYLKNELEISSIQNQMDIQNKMADLEREKVDIAKKSETRMGDQFKAEMEFRAKQLTDEMGLKTKEQELRVSQWATQNLIKMQELNALREANKINEDRYRKEYELAVERANNDLKKLDISKDLTKAQIEALNAETLFKRAETAITDAERRSLEDTDGLIGNEVALTNGVAQLLGMDSVDFQALDVNARKSLIDERLKQVRLGGGNLEDPSLQPLKKLSDLYLNQSFLRMSPEEFAAYQQQQNQLKQQAEASVVPPNRLQTSFGGQYGGMLGG